MEELSAWDRVHKAHKPQVQEGTSNGRKHIGKHPQRARVALDILRGDCGTSRGPAGMVVLIPMMQPGKPAIEGKPVPVMPSQWAEVPAAWSDKRDRAGWAA